MESHEIHDHHLGSHDLSLSHGFDHHASHDASEHHVSHHDLNNSISLTDLHAGTKRTAESEEDLEAKKFKLDENHEIHHGNHVYHGHDHVHGHEQSHDHSHHNHSHDHSHDQDQVEQNQEEDDGTFDLLAQLQSIEHQPEVLPLPHQPVVPPVMDIPSLHHLLSLNADQESHTSTPSDSFHGVPLHSITPTSFPPKPEPIQVYQPQRSMSTSSILGSLGYSNLDQPLTREQSAYCNTILKALMKNRNAEAFLRPVDYVALRIPDYPVKIRNPMDLGTVQRKLNGRHYHDMAAFVKDVNLIFQNCYLYNGPNHAVSLAAKSLEDQFNLLMRNMPRGDHHSPAVLDYAESESDDERWSKPRKPRAPSSVKSDTPDSKWAKSVLSDLTNKRLFEHNQWFLKPVDTVRLNIPHYFDIIKHPMDFGTIRKKLDRGEYYTLDMFHDDVQLVFSNCFTFNPPNTPAYNSGQYLKRIFEDKWRNKPDTSAFSPIDRFRGNALEPIRTNSFASASSFASPLAYSATDAGSDVDDSDEELSRRIDKLVQAQAEILGQLNGLLQAKQNGKVKAKRERPRSSVPRPRPPKPEKKKKPPKQRQQSYDYGFAAPPKVHRPPVYPTHPAHVVITPEIKTMLTDQINNLDGDAVEKVVEIIQTHNPDLVNSETGEVELEIDQLNDSTLRALYQFVVKIRGNSIVPAGSVPQHTLPGGLYEDDSSDDD